MPVGIIVTVTTLAVLVPMMLVISRVFGGLSRQRAEVQRLLQVGTPAMARVMSTQMGGMTVTTNAHRHLQLVMQLQVHPPGRPPYQAALTSLVSELQIPQLQPGAMVQVRIDPANPAKLALEAVGGVGMHHAAASHAAPSPAHAASAHGMPHAATPRMQYGHAPRMQYGASPAASPGMTPVQPVTMPAGAKVGLVVGIVGALLGVAVPLVITMMDVGSTSSAPSVTVPSSSTPTAAPSEVCQRAVRCCDTAASDSADHCVNLAKPGVPDHACQSALEGFERTATALGKTCE